jgi:hypothetical protein
MTGLQQFFAPIPLWFVALITLGALVLGVVICMPTKWAERFFGFMTRFFSR